MRKSLKVAGGFVGAGLLLVAGFLTWATVASARVLSRSYEAHAVDFPVPFPVTAEADSAAETLDEAAVRAAAIERGRHLLDARYTCKDCHGADLSGGTMVDAFPIGSILGPNLTRGAGSVVASFGPADWDRIVRHGINADGTPALMPSQDFAEMSDQELSDIIAYIGSLPPVDNEVPESALGPLGKVLVATGGMPLAADRFGDRTEHLTVPPPAEVSLDFGRHLSAVCTGCHGANFAGGPIVGGDPSWIDAANLTSHDEGLGGWDFETFAAAFRSGVSPDGVEYAVPMSFVVPVASNMTDVEVEAIWLYLQSLPPLPTGG